MGWASRPPIVKGGQVAHPTRLDNLFPGSPLAYTPKHSWWLNQVEIWFSILVRKLLRRASFISQDDLKNRTLNFIDYCNQIMAKPFKWIYKGNVLAI
ncbi:MAG: transposase [Nostoc sp.]|uniref:transposase n=1 Tax=Nostoc sp. TaxID=1180 RepID=UPI002FF85FF2